jgi:putative exosortase-associated protein (TIGR04073 family)
LVERRRTPPDASLLPVLAFLLLLVPSVGAAYDDDAGVPGPVQKLGRGVANVVTGVLALPGSIAAETRADGVAGVPKGIGLGLWRTVSRELVGVYEMVTFPIPVPDDYRPILEPPYPWD